MGVKQTATNYGNEQAACIDTGLLRFDVDQLENLNISITSNLIVTQIFAMVRALF